MPLKAYWASDLILGGTGAADKIKTADLADKDVVFIPRLSDLQTYMYAVDDDLGGAEDSPSLIVPDDEGGNKRLTLLGLTARDITIVDGSSLSLQEDITFTGATTVNQIKMPDNLADALSVLEAANKYMTFITSDGDEDILFSKPVDIHHTATMANDHALEIDVNAATYGDIKGVDIAYTTGNIVTGRDEGIILVNIDETLATGGEVFGLEVLSTDGNADGIHGMKCGPVVAPIHQNSGTFINPTLATNNTPDTNVPYMRDGVLANTTAIFEAQNAYIIISSDTAIEDLELVFSTAASKSIRPTFHYSISGTDTFTAFTPVDGTDGCRHTGVVSWDASDLSGHVADTGTGKFAYKIIRTRNNMTAPVLGYAKTAATTEYIWDEDGDLSIKGFTTADICGIGTAPTSDMMLRVIAADAQSTIFKGVYGLTLSDATTNYGVMGIASGGGGTTNVGVLGQAGNATNNYAFQSITGDASFANNVDISSHDGATVGLKLGGTLVNNMLDQAASPTFAGCSLGTGELTTGSINRASDDLLLEVGGNLGAAISGDETIGDEAQLGGTGTYLFAADHHATGANAMVVNVCYGTGAAPTANTTTIGTLYVKYAA